jgi:hypothetical protein
MKRTTALYFTYAWGGTPNNGELKLGRFVDHMDVINRTNFYRCLMNNFWASGGVTNEDLPLKGIWILQHCLALPRWHVMPLIVEVWFLHLRTCLIKTLFLAKK